MIAVNRGLVIARDDGVSDLAPKRIDSAFFAQTLTIY